MARDAYYVVNRYAAKMSGSHLGSVFADQYLQMVTNFATYYGEISSIIDATKQLINAYGVSLSQYPYYLTYAREIYRHRKRYGGRTFYALRDAIRHKWLIWGLDERILREIDLNIFGINPDTPRS